MNILHPLFLRQTKTDTEKAVIFYCINIYVQNWLQKKSI